MLACPSLKPPSQGHRQAAVVSEGQSARGSAPAAQRGAALLTRSALRGVLEVSGRRASPFRPSGGFDSPPAGRTKGMTKEERKKHGGAARRLYRFRE